MTYTEIKTAIEQAEPEASSTPYSTYLSDWINRTHKQWARGNIEDPRRPDNVRVPREPYRWNLMQKTSAAIATVASTETLDTSSITDLLRVRYIYYVDGNTPIPLDRTEEWIAQHSFTTSSTGRPTHWFWRGESVILRPVPDDAYSMYLVYHWDPDTVSGSDEDPLMKHFGEGIVLGARAMLADFGDDVEKWAFLKGRESDAFARAMLDDQTRFRDAHDSVHPIMTEVQVQRDYEPDGPSFGKGGWA